MEVQSLLPEQDVDSEIVVPTEAPGRSHGRARVVLGSMAMLAVLAVGAKSASSQIHGAVEHQQTSTEGVVMLAADGADAETEATEQIQAKKAEEEAALNTAGELTALANRFKTKADKLKSSADSLYEKEDGMNKDIANTQEDAKQKREAAEKARAHAEELRKKQEELRKQAEAEDKRAAGLDQDALQDDGVIKQTQAKADSVNAKAEDLKASAKSALTQATEAETKALQNTADQRMCIDLPGVKLRGEGPTDFGRIVGEVSITDEYKCKDWCLRHAECKQSVWSYDTKACELFTTALAEPIMFRERWPWYNSSYCGLAADKDDMLDMLHKVYDQKPWVPPPHNCSWGGENCIETKCCADSCKANWQWTECKYFTCWQKDEYFASCNVGPATGGWDGTRLGGHDNGEIAPAPDGKLVQGTRLYCFTVVMWNQGPKEGWMSSEAELANNWKDKGLGIMQCDDYSMFDGLEGGSEHNIQSFIRAWKMVKDDGRWKNNDWVIKVDADAVFFPDHLRKKIAWVYKTPQGSTVYLRNTFYKFNFLGALEVLTREAAEIFFERSWECEAKLGQQGGEDYWLLQCLEGLGIDYQTDNGLLHDKYAADENCGDPNGVAHHFFKKVDAWDTCWNIANDAWNNAHPE